MELLLKLLVILSSRQLILLGHLPSLHVSVTGHKHQLQPSLAHAVPTLDPALSAKEDLTIYKMALMMSSTTKVTSYMTIARIQRNSRSRTMMKKEMT